MLGWWRRRKHAIALARAEATALMHDYGDRAYYEARNRAIEARRGTLFDDRPKGHWDRVQNDIATRTGRSYVDTATRMLYRDE